MTDSTTSQTRPSDVEWEDRVAALWADETVDDQVRIDRMRELAAVAPHPALGAFELGGAHDSGGRESEAHEHYAAATASGLADVDPDRAAQLVVQHASTLRNLGRIDEAIAMLRDAPLHPTTGGGAARLPRTRAAQRGSGGRGAAGRDRGRRADAPPVQPVGPRVRRRTRRS